MKDLTTRLPCLVISTDEPVLEIKTIKTVILFQEGRSNKRPLVLIRVQREHDLVLEMDSVASRRKFLVKLDTFLAQHKKALNLTQVRPTKYFHLNFALINYSHFTEKLIFHVRFRDIEIKYWHQQKQGNGDNVNWSISSEKLMPLLSDLHLVKNEEEKKILIRR